VVLAHAENGHAALVAAVRYHPGRLAQASGAAGAGVVAAAQS
jgi:hypothetical protein